MRVECTHMRALRPFINNMQQSELKNFRVSVRRKLAMAEVAERTLDLVKEWLQHDQNSVTRGEIEELVKAKDEDTLKGLLESRMTFGTAGLRALMGAGYSRMNDLTIIQTTQGLSQYLLSQFTQAECETRGVVIGFDARHNSKRFAQLAAGIFLNKNFKVYLFSGHTPTPYTPYAVKVFRCLCGIQVTASHNPKQYNGYKVYWVNGAQIIPPHDMGIASSIDRELVPWPTSWDTSIVEGSSRVLDPTQTVLEGYYQGIKRYCFRHSENPSLGVKVTFTPMHGVGGEPVQRAFRVFNLPEPIPVAEQMQPDPEFPTVLFPNPEEGKSALDLAIQTANSAGSTIILATDPDADRLALAEKNAVTGKWKVFNGNEAGTLLSWWAFKNYKDSHPDFDGSKVYMMASTVSSKFIRAMAESEGFHFVETLTGFKWMGNRSHDLISQGKEVLFAFEEAIGYMFGDTVLDKDGISASAIMAEYAGWLYVQGKTFQQHLEELYLRYGRFLSVSSYYLCYEKEVIARIFNRLRKDRKYPTSCGSQAKVVSVVDLTVGYDSRNPPEFTPELPMDPNIQLITFTLNNGAIFTLRTSGTEPKIKYYVEVHSKAEEIVPQEEMQSILQTTIQCIAEEYLQPEQNGLLPRPA